MTQIMRKVFFGILCTVFILAAASANAETLKPSHKITSVEVFSDRAIVKRSADVKFEKDGVYEVEITPLPMELDENSVRVEAEGTASAKIAGVELKSTFLKKYDNEKIKALKKELEGLRKDKALIEAKLRNQEAAKKFLEEIKFKTHENMSRDVEKGKVSVVDWQSVLDFYVRGLNKADEEISALAAKKKDLDEKISDIEKELRSANDASGKGLRSAIVSFDVKKAGDLKIELSYMTFGAGWRPSYDARAITAKNAVEITSYGDVWQSTGEDWKDVSVTLSTARPSLGAGVPELYPWYLSPPVYLEKRSKGKSIGFGVMSKEAAPASPEVEEYADEAMEEAAPMTAEITEGFTATTFTIKKKTDIPSGNDTVKTVISTDKLDAVFKYKTVPKLSQYAFLEAEAKNTAGYPLLPGSVNAFIDEKFVGALHIKAIAPEEKLELSLGIDEGIKIERKLAKSERGKSGVLSSKKRSLYIYEIEVTNFKKQDAEITIVDQLPVSQDKNIVVGVDELMPEPTEKTERGILKWKVLLKAGEKKKIRFGFHADYPSELPDPL